MLKIINFIAKNTVKIPGFVLAVIVFLTAFDIYTFTEAQRIAVDGLVASILLFFTTTTVTANIRLGSGSIFGKFAGGKRILTPD